MYNGFMPKGAVRILAGLLLLAPGIWAQTAGVGTGPAEIPREPRDFLLLGLQVSPRADGFSNAWVVSEGRDFRIFGLLLGGYEIGMFHRTTGDRLEYRFKTFLNLKGDLLPDRQAGVYIGAGGGFFEILRTSRMESGFKFALAFQGLIGLRVGARGRDKFLLELQALKANDPDPGWRFHILAGARF